MYTQHLGHSHGAQQRRQRYSFKPVWPAPLTSPIDVFASNDEVGASGEETMGQGEGIMAQGELDEGGLEDGECRYCLGQEHDSLEFQQEGSEWPPGWESDNE